MTTVSGDLHDEKRLGGDTSGRFSINTHRWNTLNLMSHAEDTMRTVLGAGDVAMCQDGSPTITPCAHCGEAARVAFVAAERGRHQPLIADPHESLLPDGGDCWMYDLAAFADHLCTGCTEPACLHCQCRSMRGLGDWAAAPMTPPLVSRWCGGTPPAGCSC